MKRRTLTLAGVLFAGIAVSGCGKKEEAAPTVAPAPPAVTPPAPAPAPVPAPAAVIVESVDLGNTVGPDLRVAAPMATFGKQDTIIAAVATTTRDPAANVPGRLGARWTFGDQVVNEETREVNFNGAGVTNFEISKPDGWPVGAYKLEISLDGQVVQTRDFSVN